MAKSGGLELGDNIFWTLISQQSNRIP